MSETVKGAVGFIKTKSIQTKRGMGTVYSIKIEDGPWVSFGFDKPDFNKGDIVEFEVEGQYNNVKSHKVVKKGSSSQATAPVGDKDRRIVRQNALSHATQIALALLPEKRPSSDVVAERVIKLAERFEAYVMDDEPEE